MFVFSNSLFLTKPTIQFFMLASGDKVFASKKLDMNTTRTYFNFKFLHTAILNFQCQCNVMSCLLTLHVLHIV